MQMIFNLDNAAQQPVLCLENFHRLRVLIDTGAMLPMWIKSRELLESLGGKNENYKLEITGASGINEMELYRIDIPFGEIIYHDMPIIYNPISTEGLKNIHLIFGATNFRDMTYTIDTIENKLKIDYPGNQKIINVKLLNADGTINILAYK